MTERDPAAARFAVIQIMRLAGVAMVVLGMLAATGRLSQLPEWAGYLLLVIGLADVFVMPTLLARRWRSPK